MEKTVKEKKINSNTNTNNNFLITYSVMCIVHLIHIVIIWNFNLGLLDIKDRIPAVESQINQRKEAFFKKN